MRAAERAGRDRPVFRGNARLSLVGLCAWYLRMQAPTLPVMKLRRPLLVFIATSNVAGMATQMAFPVAHAAPAPEVEYTYNVMVRRHYDFPNNDAIGYGEEICDHVTHGESYSEIMSDVKRDLVPDDEFAANYVVSYAVNLLCPGQIWQLRKSAEGYQLPPPA